MGDRRKPKRTRSKASSERRLKEDKISELPDPLICEILCHLPTKEAVRTSVLSTRWKSLWLWIPRLNLQTFGFPDYDTLASFGDRFFDSTRDSSCLDEFKIHIVKRNDKVDVVTSRLTSWVDAAAKRKIQHLRVRFLSNRYTKMPSSLYKCEKLVSLDLHLVALANAEFVYLPCVKTMYLHDNVYPNEDTFERLVSSSPVLEVLRIGGSQNSDAIAFRVRSVSLKSLTVREFMYPGVRGSGVVIDAPRLCFLSIGDNCSESYKVAKMDTSSLLKLDLSLGDFGVRTLSYPRLASAIRRFRGFVHVMSKVRDMTVSMQMFQVLYQYSKSEPLPQYGYMSSMHLTLCVPQYESLPTLLESFPNIKSLILACRDVYNRYDEICFSSVPECLLSSLEFVDFKDPIGGYLAEMKLVKYFLNNSATLKKLTLRLDSSSAKDEVLKKLLKIPRGSTKCKVVIL